MAMRYYGDSETPVPESFWKNARHDGVRFAIHRELEMVCMKVVANNVIRKIPEPWWFKVASRIEFILRERGWYYTKRFPKPKQQH